MSAKPKPVCLPYAWTEEQVLALPVLPSRPAFVVVPDDLQTRLDTAARRVVEATTQAEREAAEAECVAIWREIDSHEAEERVAEEERRADSMTSREDELR